MQTEFLRTNGKARHGFAKSTQKVVSSALITEYIDATSCVNFAKPCLASRSSWVRRANCGLWRYHKSPSYVPR